MNTRPHRRIKISRPKQLEVYAAAAELAELLERGARKKKQPGSKVINMEP